MTVKYYEPKEISSLIGTVVKEPSLLDDSDIKRINENDFYDPVHRLVYFSLSNLYHEGHSKITGELIYDYLSSRPKLLELFEKNKGYEFINESVKQAKPTSIKPIVERIKKMSLLRGLNNIGIDVGSIYTWEEKDPLKATNQENKFTSMSLMEIGSIVSDRIDKIMEEASVASSSHHSAHASEGMREMKERLKLEPDFGAPLYGKMINTILRGARISKFYLRSAPTGNGKSRMLMADALNLAAPEIYDTEKKQWVDNGGSQPATFITTELDLEETQTLQIAFLSGVNEDIILEGKYTGDEEARVDKAIEIIENSPFWIEHIPDFSVNEIEMIIRRNVRERGVQYVFFDYIHTSMKFLAEITAMTNGMKLREDQILFMLSSKLKDLANELDVFIESATQISGNLVAITYFFQVAAWGTQKAC